MKTIITTMLLSSTLIYAANVAAADVCPTVETIHQNALALDSVYHQGKHVPKRYDGMLPEGYVYSSHMFKSLGKKWDLGADVSPGRDESEEFSDDQRLQMAQTLANEVSQINMQIHASEPGKYELHLCGYGQEELFPSVIAVSIKGKLPKELNVAITKMTTKK